MVSADKGYRGEGNRSFLSLNKFGDGIMRKDTTTAKLTERGFSGINADRI